MGILLLTLFASPQAFCHEAAGGERITVAIPDDGGLVSLGIFSTEGQLIHAFRQLAPESEFTIDTNGLAITWDRTNNAGNPVPPGAYQVRGWFVPPTVVTRGMAIHFNDWIDGEGDLPLAEVLGVVAEDGDQFLLIGREAGTGTPAAWKATEEGLDGNVGRFEKADRLLFADKKTALFTNAGGRGILAFTIADLQAEPAVAFEDHKIIAAAVAGRRTLACTEQGNLLAMNDLLANPQNPFPMKSPPGITLLTAGSNGFFVSDGTRIWAEKNGDFQEIPTGDRFVVLDLAAGPEGTLWVAGHLKDQGGHAFARQYSDTGELLRELNLHNEIPVGIFTPENSLGIFLLTREDPAGPIRLKGLRPLVVHGGTSNLEGAADWEVFVDRSIHPTPGDRARDGIPDFPVENGKSAPSQEATLVVSPNSLQSKPQKIMVRTAFGGEGAWIEDDQGLRLVQICELKNIQTTALRATKIPGTFRVLVTLPGGALEYDISGLEQIVQLRAGEIILSRNPSSGKPPETSDAHSQMSHPGR